MALLSILFLYLGIGLLAALGSVTITRARFSVSGERVFYALLLIPIGAIYLAFVNYYAAPEALGMELGHLVALTGVSLLGLRFPILVALAYFAHGGWDLLHEVTTLNQPLLPQALTPIPLAYGLFCAGFDWAIAIYLLRSQGRRTS